MCSLKPPFTANDMNGLYKKVTRGVYPKIPSQYSSNLNKVIRNLLQVSAHLRPTCEDALKMKEVEFHLEDDLVYDSELEDGDEQMDLL